METKWTKGPWVVAPIRHLIEKHRKDTPTFYTASVEPASPGNYRGPICHMQSCEHISGIDGNEAEANARLIAAAPEMFALLERMTNAAERRLRELRALNSIDALQLTNDIADARALLAKVTNA